MEDMIQLHFFLHPAFETIGEGVLIHLTKDFSKTSRP